MSGISERELTDYLVEHQAQLYRLAYSYLKHPEDALDAVQTTVCRAIEKQSTLRCAQAVPTWTRRILINVCRDILRRRSRVITVDEGRLTTESCEDTYPSDSTLLEQINALPAEAAVIIKLRFFEELSLKEISEITSVNLNTVKTRLYAGLKKLRRSIESTEGDARK